MSKRKSAMRTWWVLWDAEDTYVPSLHSTRSHARRERSEHSYLRDAKWRIVKVAALKDKP